MFYCTSGLIVDFGDMSNNLWPGGQLGLTWLGCWLVVQESDCSCGRINPWHYYSQSSSLTKKRWLGHSCLWAPVQLSHSSRDHMLLLACTKSWTYLVPVILFYCYKGQWLKTPAQFFGTERKQLLCPPAHPQKCHLGVVMWHLRSLRYCFSVQYFLSGLLIFPILPV